MIWAVGRNFPAHAAEMGAMPPAKPMIFSKSAATIIQDSESFPIPVYLNEVHHEIELAFLWDKNKSFSHFTLALDLTDRVEQKRAKNAGEPWTLAKSFQFSCPMAAWKPLPENMDLDIFNSWNIELRVNGEIKQQSLLGVWIFNPKRLKSYIEEYFPVVPGDALLTGTPEGVGPLRRGDRLFARLTDEKGLIQIEKSWFVSEDQGHEFKK